MNDTERPTNVRWLVFALACGSSWFLYLHRYTWNFVGPELQKEYGFSNTQMGTLFTMFSPTYGGGQIPSGILSDLIGPHIFLGTIIILWALVLPCFGLTGNFYGLSGLRLTFGAAQSGCYPNLSRITRTWFPVRSRTIMQGWIASFSGRTGGAASAIIMGLLFWAGLSWQTCLLVMGGVGLLFGIAFLILFRNTPEQDPRVNQAELNLIREGDEASKEAPAILPFRRVMRSRNMWSFVIQQVMSAGADVIYVSLMGKYFLERFGAEQESGDVAGIESAEGFDIVITAILVSLPLFGGALGGMLGGFCNDWMMRLTGSRRWGRSLVGFTGKFLACILMFVAISQESRMAAGSALFAVKFFSDWSQPTVWGTCTDLGGRYSATVFGIINTSGTVGGLISPIVFGLILDLADWSVLFSTVAAMYIISAVCWFMIDCTKSIESQLIEEE